jgi:WD40 repeat protein
MVSSRRANDLPDFLPQGELYPWLSNQFSTEIIPKQPPTDFDPSGSQLRFLYSGDIYFGPARATEVQVLADDYTLGKIKINHLFKTACKRSPDGRLIVLFTREDPPSLLSDLLTLYNLSDLKPAPMTFPGNLLVRTAFSPDSRTLAVAGIDFNSPVSHVYLADLADGGRLELPVMEPVWSLAWRPDGRQLAALHWPSFRQSPKFAVHITVYDLYSKGLTHDIIDPDLDWGSTEAAIPLEGWVASFPLPMDGLESCSSAPGRSDLSQESPLIPSDLK